MDLLFEIVCGCLVFVYECFVIMLYTCVGTDFEM